MSQLLQPTHEIEQYSATATIHTHKSERTCTSQGIVGIVGALAVLTAGRGSEANASRTGSADTCLAARTSEHQPEQSLATVSTSGHGVLNSPQRASGLAARPFGTRAIGLGHPSPLRTHIAESADPLGTPAAFCLFFVGLGCARRAAVFWSRFRTAAFWSRFAKPVAAGNPLSAPAAFRVFGVGFGHLRFAGPAVAANPFVARGRHSAASAGSIDGVPRPTRQAAMAALGPLGRRRDM